MQEEFEMSMIGELNFFLGTYKLEINMITYLFHNLSTLKKCWRSLEWKMLNLYVLLCLLVVTWENMLNHWRLIKAYISMIGGLLYLTVIRLDILHGVCLVVIFQQDPRETHVVVMKRIFRYLKGMNDYGLWYPKISGFTLIAYIDVHWVRCVDDRKSSSGGVFFLESQLVAWSRNRI